MKPEREYSLTLHGIRIAVAEWGSESAEPLLFLHGWLDNAASFSSLAEILCAEFRCIALDLPGHGRAEHLPGTVNYHFLDGVQNIFEACEALALNPVHLVGHSMGGALGMLYAGAFPERVKSFVSIEAFGPITRPAHEAASQFSHAVLDHVKRRESRKNSFKTIEDALAARAAVADCDAPLLRPIVERSLVANADGFQWCSDARLRLPGLMRMSKEQVLSFVKMVTAPVLVIKASKGLTFVDDAIKSLSHGLKHLKMVELDGGHHIHLEKPDETAAILKTFIGEFNHLPN